MTNPEPYPPIGDVLAAAEKLGATAGRNAASWYTDGNTTDHTYRQILKGIEDGDPAELDKFNLPNLSGEWMGDYTPATLANALGFDAADLAWQEIEDDVCSAWEQAASDAFWAQLEHDCRVVLDQ